MRKSISVKCYQKLSFTPLPKERTIWIVSGGNENVEPRIDAFTAVAIAHRDIEVEWHEERDVTEGGLIVSREGGFESRDHGYDEPTLYFVVIDGVDRPLIPMGDAFLWENEARDELKREQARIVGANA